MSSELVNPPLISVIVLTYKNIESLLPTLVSIFQQDYSNIELLISDDSTPGISCEDIWKIVNEQQIHENIKNIIVQVQETNLGTVKNLNSILKKASGEIFSLISASDLYYSESVLSKVSNFFEDKRCLICTTKRMVVSEDRKQSYIKPTEREIKILENSTADELFVELSLNHFIGIGTFIKKDFYNKYGYHDEEYRLIEDLPFYLKIASSGEKIYFFDCISVIYMPGGITSQKFDYNSLLNQDRLKIYEKIIFPNIKMFTKRDKRQLRYNFVFECVRNKKGKMLITSLIYPNITLKKVYRRLRNRLISKVYKIKI